MREGRQSVSVVSPYFLLYTYIMSLSNLYGKVNTGGSNLYAMQKDRIMREAREIQDRREKQDLDRMKGDLNKRKFEKEGITRQIGELRRQIVSAGRISKDDHRYRSEVMDKERRIHMLETDQRRMEADVRSIESQVRVKEGHH